MSRNTQRRSPQLEPLESRQLLAASVKATFAESTGQLTLTADSRSSEVSIALNADNYDHAEVRVESAVDRKSEGRIATLSAGKLRSIKVVNSGGDDTFKFTSIDIPEGLEFRGGGGSETVQLSTCTVADKLVFEGNAGNDHLMLNASAVKMEMRFVGGDGDDLLSGLDNQLFGALLFEGGAGNDRSSVSGLFLAKSTMLGGDGDDNLYSGSGDDLLNDLSGNNTMNGGGGADSIRAGSGNDKINGGLGNDTIWGGPGNDEIYGDNGNDRLIGEEGKDTLTGNNGRDFISGNLVSGDVDGESDLLYGNRTFDTFVTEIYPRNGVATNRDGQVFLSEAIVEQIRIEVLDKNLIIPAIKPEMPTIRVRATVLDAPPGTTVNHVFKAFLAYSAPSIGRSMTTIPAKGSGPDNQIVQLKIHKLMGGQVIITDTALASRGGIVTATYGQNGEVRIKGENPTDQQILDYVKSKSTPPSDYPGSPPAGLTYPEIILKIIYWESKGKQFLDNGEPKWSSDGFRGAGLMQITPATDEAVWNWMKNIDVGIATFKRALTNARKHETTERAKYPGLPTLTPEQRIREALRRYNGTGPNNQPEYRAVKQQGNWVWEPVPVSERPTKPGDPDYVNKVMKTQPPISV